MHEMSCAGCFWREGGRCYAPPMERDEHGFSKKLAEKRCDLYDPPNWAKRAAKALGFGDA